MPIQLIINGEHATDLFAEIQTLANALGITASRPTVAIPQEAAEVVNSHDETPTPVEIEHLPTHEVKKSLTRKEQDEAEAAMIAAGVKDDRFDMLTRGRQNNVEAAIAKTVAQVETLDAADDMDDLFDNDSAPVTVTRDMVSALMGKVGKDKDGSPIQARLLKIREILVDYTPEGQEIKVKNIPEDKLAIVHSLIEKIGT